MLNWLQALVKYHEILKRPRQSSSRKLKKSPVPEPENVVEEPVHTIEVRPKEDENDVGSTIKRTQSALIFKPESRDLSNL